MKGKVLGKAKELVLTEEQRSRLEEYATAGQGGYQSLCGRVVDRIRHKDGKIVAQVYEADMERISEAAQHGDDGGWQGLFREIVLANTP